MMFTARARTSVPRGHRFRAPIPSSCDVLFPTGGQRNNALATRCATSTLVTRRCYRSPLKKLRTLSDLRAPATWFPRLGDEKRKVIIHVGPTNSGKTHNALQAFLAAPSAIYGSPLRLLAHEIWKRSNDSCVPCLLLTGEERRSAYAPGTDVQETLSEAEDDELQPLLGKAHADHVACTVEMMSTTNFVDVAVIDEIQMLGDPDRGWAWTQAILGVRARELHLCGEASAVQLIESICKALGESCEVRTYDRLSPLTVASQSIKNMRTDICSGDCIITFSRRGIFDYKRRVEEQTGMRCAVIYGGLPPETRNEQARLFNDSNSDFNVMIASDAIGMGLNLHIRRIIFTTTRKYGGPQVGLVRLSVSQVKQISGRAGRYGKGHTSAEPNVSALNPNDLDYIRQCVQAPLSAPLTKAGLYPTAAIVEEFASLLPHQSLAALLTKFEETARLDTSYFLASLDGPKILADAIERYPLPTSDRFTMVSAPVKIQAEDEVRAFVELARARSAHVHSNRLTIEPSHTARSDQPIPSRRYRALVALFQRGHGFSILDLDFIRASILQNHANRASVADIRDALARASTSITDAEKLFQLAWPVPKRPEALVHYEAVHRVVTLFLWLHYRFPTTFPGLTLAAKMKAYCENIIDFGLLSIDHSRVAAARQRREEERKSAPDLLQRIRDDSWYDDDLFPSDEEFDLPPGKK